LALSYLKSGKLLKRRFFVKQGKNFAGVRLLKINVKSFDLESIFLVCHCNLPLYFFISLKQKTNDTVWP